MSAFAAVRPDGPLYRLAREPDPWAWPAWSHAGPDGTFGNRWDDPDGSYRVLYASSQRLGAFVETLAQSQGSSAVLHATNSEQIETDDPDLLEALRILGLKLL